MSNIILVDTKKHLDKIISKSNPDGTEIVLVSNILSAESVDKDFTCHEYAMLIPPMSIINRLLIDGDDEVFYGDYLSYLHRPLVHYFLNEIIRRMVKYERDMVIACAADEQEFRYLPFIGESIENIYEISPIGYKDWKNGRESEKGLSDSRLIEISYSMAEKLYAKCYDSTNRIPFHKCMRIGKNDLDKLSKHEKKELKKLYKIGGKY